MPIIKLKDREKSFETDISVENWTSVRNAFLLKCYSECDPRVKPLVMVIKMWAQRAEITDARVKRLAGTLGEQTEQLINTAMFGLVSGIQDTSLANLYIRSNSCS